LLFRKEKVLPEIDKVKFLVPEELTLSQLANILRKKQKKIFCKNAQNLAGKFCLRKYILHFERLFFGIFTKISQSHGFLFVLRQKQFTCEFCDLPRFLSKLQFLIICLLLYFNSKLNTTDCYVDIYYIYICYVT